MERPANHGRREDQLVNYKFGGPAEAFPLFDQTMLPTDHNWAGFYAGVNAGGGLTTSRSAVVGTIRGENDFSGNGFAGGAQAGYNVMGPLRPSWFAGVAADIGYLGINTSHRERNDFVR
jgi:hypothetical protein